MLAPPRALPKTIDRPDRFFTLHTRPNDAFTLKLSEETKVSVVGFTTFEDAHFIAQKMEMHYKRKKEWPTPELDGSIFLPASNQLEELTMVAITEWELENLKYYCTSNILDLISVEEIKSQGDSFSFSGNMYKFSAAPEFYQDRFNQILALEQ